jgi:hypothetical protein
VGLGWPGDEIMGCLGSVVLATVVAFLKMQFDMYQANQCGVALQSRFVSKTLTMPAPIEL